MWRHCSLIVASSPLGLTVRQKKAWGAVSCLGTAGALNGQVLDLWVVRGVGLVVAPRACDWRKDDRIWIDCTMLEGESLKPCVWMQNMHERNMPGVFAYFFAGKHPLIKFCLLEVYDL